MIFRGDDSQKVKEIKEVKEILVSNDLRPKSAKTSTTPMIKKPTLPLKGSDINSKRVRMNPKEKQICSVNYY
jgi:hypothetical protein